MRPTDDVEKGRNKIGLDRISFHLDQAMRFCNQLDLSGLRPVEQREWDNRMKTCKNAIEFTKGSLQELNNILNNFYFVQPPCISALSVKAQTV